MDSSVSIFKRLDDFRRAVIFTYRSVKTYFAQHYLSSYGHWFNHFKTKKRLTFSSLRMMRFFYDVSQNIQ